MAFGFIGFGCRGRAAREAAALVLSPEKLAQIEAVTALKEKGEKGFPALLAALKDPDPDIRIAAADALGETGDERAVGPLVEALRASFVGHSPRWHLAVGVIMAVCAVLLVIGFVRGMLYLKLGGIIGTQWWWVAQLAGSWEKKRKAKSRPVLAITRALEAIAERCPTPALRDALPELRAVAADMMQRDAPTRSASKEAAARIESLTERLKSLPLPADLSARDPLTLPIPSGYPRPDLESIPLPAAEAETARVTLSAGR